ncbi:CapA family protein [Iningainema tapete]|uniref:CapA family protein n=1 Tax=Iningainema tapete TaxID=2806730 RepID=UPI00308029F4
MAKNLLGRLVALSFISFCFCIGIRFGQSQRSNAATTTNKLIPVSSSVIDYIPINPLQEQISDSITIQAVGDIIPGTNFPNYRLPSDRNHLIPKSVRAYLQRSDILFGNFETSLTKHPYTAKDINRGQVFAFRSPPTYAQLFAEVGFDVLNIANNHALDFGVVGLRDTTKNLSSVGIETLGHKNQILYLQVNSIPVAMIGFAPYEFYNSIHDLEVAKALVEKAQKNANIVIVSMHAGAEGTSALRVKNRTEYFYGENRGNALKFARTMIDAGADLVLGHGPHVPRAIEVYNGKLIAYSLGNFLGYRTLSTAAQTGYSMILEVKLSSQGDLVSSKVIPVRMDSQGIPHIDQYFRTVGLLRYLINNDFPDTNLKINKKGEIVMARE